MKKLLILFSFVLLLSVLVLTGCMSARFEATADGSPDADAAHAHYGGQADCQHLALCAECNQAYGEYGDHRMTEATCSARSECTVCEIGRAHV